MGGNPKLTAGQEESLMRQFMTMRMPKEVKTEADYKQLLEAYQYKHYFKTLRLNGLLFKFFQKGIDRDDMFKVNIGLNFYYDKVFGEPLYNENGQVQSDAWLNELKSRQGVDQADIEEQIERQLAWILVKDKTKADLE